MSLETLLSCSQDLVSQLSKNQQEADWMLASRLLALQNVASLPLPRPEKTNIEQWNFTQFKYGAKEESVGSVDQLPQEIRDYLFDTDSANLVVQKNESIIFKQQQEELARQGVILTDLSSATRDHADLVKKYFMNEGIKKNEHRLAAMHAAFFTDGVFLYVPKGVELTLPVQSLFWLSGKEMAMFPHVVIVAEEYSSVEFFASYIGQAGDHAALSNSMLEVFVGDHAHVKVSTVNCLNASTVDVTYRRSIVGYSGQLDWVVADLSQGKVISDNTVYLNGAGGQVDIKSVALGVDEMRSNITAAIHHVGQHTKSDIHARMVMKDTASSILNSVTKIEKGASKSDGQQSSKVLMLNPKARGDANPILLIDENDVVAGHAASVGRVDQLQMYYLMSRGIPKEQAEKLIIFGFLDAVIKEIPSSSLRQSIHNEITRKFKS